MSWLALVLGLPRLLTAQTLTVSVTPASPLNNCSTPPTLTASATYPPFVNTLHSTSGFQTLALQPDGKFLIAGQSGDVGRFNADGSRDFSFVGLGVNSWIYSIGVQDDGKVVVGGMFNQPVGHVVRLLPNGTPEPNFPQANNTVGKVVPQPNGRVLVCGHYTYIGGAARNGLALINADGSVDNNFNPTGLFGGIYNTLRPVVYAAAIGSDGKVWVGGVFSLPDQPLDDYHFTRLNADGSRDTNLLPVTFNGAVNNILIQPDGKVLTSGGFSAYQGVAARNIARLNPDGTLDTSFAIAGTGFDAAVNSIALQPDGKILVVGDFTSYNGTPRSRIARLLPNGDLDPSFTQTGTGIDDEVETVALQPDGRVLIGGFFRNYDSNSRVYVTRLRPDGSLDTDPTAALGATYRWSNGTTGSTLVASQAGSYTATATVGNRSANSTAVLINSAPPTVASFTPGGGPAPTSVVVSGTNLIGVTEVLFNGTPATFTVGSTTQLTAVVPAGATNGPITVRTSCGAATSSGSYLAILPPAVTSFLPARGPAGTAVTITGTNFTGATGVQFAGVGASSFTVTSSTTLTAVVPTGAAPGAITVTNPGGAISTSTIFTPTTGSFTVTVTPAGPVTMCAGFTQTLTAAANSPAFAVGTGFNQDVQVLALQADGKILVGGNFSSYNGVAVGTVARLLIDGSLDTTFPATGSGLIGTVQAIAVQSDGKILVGGSFSNFNGVARGNLVRLNADGSLDMTFAAGTGFDGAVQALAVQADGKVLAGGTFSNYNGTARPNLARLNADGTLDNTFVQTGTGLDGWVYVISLQPNGKILVSGSFSYYNTSRRGSIARLNADGSLDTSFAPTGSGPNRAAKAILVQPDGRILVGGTFYNYGSTYRPFLVRLNDNGTVDNGFSSGFDYFVNALVLQPDGKVVVGGSFFSYNGTSRRSLARLTASGTLDTSFSPSSNAVNAEIVALVLQDDGKVICGGLSFTGINRLDRLNPNGVANFRSTPVTGVSYTWSNGSTGASLNVNNAGTYTVTGTSGGSTATSAPVQIIVDPLSTITAFTPASGAGATRVTISGTHFGAVTAVHFNGTAASFTIGSATELTAVVPAGASSGPITLETPCSTVTSTTNFVVPAAPRVWTGNLSNNWNEAGNWQGNSVPTATDDVSIPLLTGTQVYPVLAGGTYAARNLTLAAGATLTLTTGTLAVQGSFSNNGNVVQTGGLLNFVGTQEQVIGVAGHRTVLREVSIGPAGARLAGPVQVESLLRLNGDLTSNGQLTLLSTAQLTAMVVNSGGRVLGQSTVQRYIDPALNPGAGYRHLASPVQATAVADLGTASFTPVVNPAYNTAANPGNLTPFPTVFGYDERRLSGRSAAGFDHGWVSPTSLTDTLAPGHGYTVNLAPQTVDFVGVLTNGPVSVDLTRGGLANSGWHLLGNPYPAPLNWDLLVRPGGVDDAIYVYRSSGPYAGSYQAYVNGIPANANLIGQSQAFFVRATAPTTFSFSNAARLTSPQPVAVYRATDRRPQFALVLQAPAGEQDVLHLYQETGATTGFDARYDALKVQLNGGQQPTLYQQAGASALSIQGLPVGNQPVALPLGLYAPTAGMYQLRAQQLNNLPAGTSIWLEDQQTGQWQDLRRGSYAVLLAHGAEASRFVLHLNSARPLAASNAAAIQPSLRVFPNPTNDGNVRLIAQGLVGSRAELRLLNSLGQLVHHEVLPPTGTTLNHSMRLAHLPTGVYAVQLVLPTGTFVQKLVVK